ncbi:lipid-transfer protein, partial [Striga asiatica]
MGSVKPIIYTLLFVQVLSLLLMEANGLPSVICSIKLSELAECFLAISGDTSPTVICCKVLHKAKLSCLCTYKKDFAKCGSTTVTMKKKPVRKSNPILKLARGLRVSDCEIQIRPSDKECSPAPRYSSTSKFFTVTLEFGGKFDIGKKYSAYLGGSTIMFDYVDYERVTLADFKSVAEFIGCKNPMRLHTYVGCGSFMLLSTETDLESVWQRQFNKVREVSLFVEELSENTEIVNAPEIENEVGEDDSDETFEWENDSEVDKLDDILFDENVDEVEVEVGVEAEEGEVEGEGEKGEGEKGE